MNYKKLIVSLATIALIFSGCGQTTTPKSQTDSVFTPVTVLSSQPNDTIPGEGPYRKTLNTAISYDGLTFIPSDETLAYQADAPDMLMRDGTLYLYYSGWLVGHEINKIAVAISDDNGKSWTHHNLTINDLPEISDPYAPDVMLLEDGSIRMYFSAHTWTQSGIYYADSTDGINFEFQDAVGLDKDRPISNSTTHEIENVWYQYVIGNDNEEIYLFEGDQDILDFTSITSFPPNGEAHRPLNGYWLDGKYQLLVMDDDTGTIRSMRTKNGTDWYTVEGERMEIPTDGTIITDATVVELEGTYFMVYSLYHPEEE